MLVHGLSIHAVFKQLRNRNSKIAIGLTYPCDISIAIAMTDFYIHVAKLHKEIPTQNLHVM